MTFVSEPAGEGRGQTREGREGEGEEGNRGSVKWGSEERDSVWEEGRDEV